MRQAKNLMDINIDALYNILKQNQGDVNDALGYKKKAVVITSDPLALVAEKIKVSKQKEKVVVSSDSEGTLSTEQPPLKDKSMCNKTAKDLWDALARHMLGSEYGEQDRKAVVFDPLALIAEKTKVSKRKEKVVVSSDSDESDADDFSKLKKITA
nr:RNA-directed DNA polymerase, eukaryota [Tanacetum cinerariifolium]